MVRVNTDILGISELKWIGMGEFNSDYQYIHYYGQESLRRHGVVLIVSERVQNAVLGCNLKNNRMILIYFQGKPFNITTIQVYGPITDAKETKVDQFYEDLQGLLELTPKKMSFHHRGLESKSRKSRDTRNSRQDWPWNTKWNRTKANGSLSRECTGHSKHLLSTT